MSAALHHAAVFDRIDGDANLQCFDMGEVPDPAPEKYVVLSSSAGDRIQSRFMGAHNQITTRHFLYGVGKTARQALWVGDKIAALCNDYDFVIAGRVVRRPTDWITRPVQVDKDLYPLPFVVVIFDLTSEPA